MRSGELFAGVGGLGMAVDAVFGSTPAWFCEFDKAPSKVLAHHHPDVPNYGDVTKVDWASAPHVDVLAGGFPCQDVSLAGRRKGMSDGTRSGLWSEFAKAIEQIGPDWVVIENVRGLLSADAGGGTRIERDCSICGWTDGRGRVHRDSRAATPRDGADVLRRPAHAGDDGASTSRVDGVPGGVGWVSDPEQGRDGALGGGLGVDAPGARSCGSAQTADAVSANQAKAGGVGSRTRGIQGIPPEQSQRVADVDTRGGASLCTDQGGDSPAEREGAACPDCGGGLNERVVSDMEPCPLCVGDDPGHVLRALGAVLGDLAELGFDAEWTGLRASDVGAPHGRFRVFILAWPASNTVSSEPERWGRPGELASAPRSSEDRARERERLWGAAVDSGPDASLSLLPTPGAYGGERGGSQHPDKRRDGGHSVTIQDVAEHLMPTPRASRGGSATETMYQLGAVRVDDERAQGQVVGDITEWGRYEAAIRRWEAVLGRPAPAPVRFDGKGGKPRLNPELTEWMMGWPAGHVTDPTIGLTRAEQLKACGNGVVPQQAIAALLEMLARPGVPGIKEYV